MCIQACVELGTGWARHTLTAEDVSAWVTVLGVGVLLACALSPEEDPENQTNGDET
jgi:hypothetical protein